MMKCSAALSCFFVCSMLFAQQPPDAKPCPVEGFYRRIHPRLSAKTVRQPL